MINIVMPRESAWSLMHSDEKTYLANLVAGLGPASVVLEVGSWCMGSACIMAANNSNIEIYCVDLYNNDRGSTYMERPVEQYDDNDHNFVNMRKQALGDRPRTLEVCQDIVKHYGNIICIQANTLRPIEELGFNKTLDIYFEDGMHRNPWLATNLNYFSQFLKVGGLLLVHDCFEYEDGRFADVISNVNELVQSGKYKIIHRVESLVTLEKIQ